MSVFAVRLAALMKADSMSKTEQAESFGVNLRTVQRYIRDEQQPTLKVLQNMADHYNVSIDFLVGRTDDPTPPVPSESKDVPDNPVADTPSL